MPAAVAPDAVPPDAAPERARAVLRFSSHAHSIEEIERHYAATAEQVRQRFAAARPVG